MYLNNCQARPQHEHTLFCYGPRWFKLIKVESDFSMQAIVDAIHAENSTFTVLKYRSVSVKLFLITTVYFESNISLVYCFSSLDFVKSYFLPLYYENIIVSKSLQKVLGNKVDSSTHRVSQRERREGAQIFQMELCKRDPSKPKPVSLKAVPDALGFREFSHI